MPLSLGTLIAAGVDPTQARQIIDPLMQTCERFAIDSAHEQAMFVAQNGHESQGFVRLEENLRWRDPKRLNAMFSAVKSEEEAATLIAKGPEAIANVVYANRNGNGPASSGDGWRYRGRGWVQLTGLANYFAAQRDLGEPYVEKPDLVATTPDAALTAGWFWDRNRCKEAAIAGDVEAVTRIINGPAMAGLDDRRKRYLRALQAFR
jgi:putative chitinase